MNNSDRHYPENIESRDYAYEDEIDLMEILRKLWERKSIIILLTILFGLGGYFFSVLKYPKIFETTSIVSLNFKGIENHLNPDGSLFKADQLVTPDILNKVYIKNNFKNNFSLTDLQKSIEVKPYIPYEIAQRIKNSKNDDEINYFPSNFYINLITKEEGVLGGQKNREQIIKGVVNEYRDSFKEAYLKADSVKINFAESLYKENDFKDLIGIFEKNIDYLNSFVRNKIENYGQYESSKLNISFNEIEKNLNIMKDNDLANINAVVQIRNLTKFKSIYIDKLSYQIEQISEQRSIKEKEYESIEELLLTLSPERASSNNTNSAAANLNIDQSFIDNLIEKDYYSFLVKKASGISTELSELIVKEEALIEKKQKLLDKGEISDSDLKLVENRLIGIGQRIEKNSVIISKLVEEFMGKKYENLIQLINYPEYEITRNGNLKLIILISGFAGFFISVFAVLVRESFLNVKK